MTVYMVVKALGRRPRTLAEQPREFAQVPKTLRELLCALVLQETEAFNARLSREDPDNLPDEASLEAMASIGKIAFGLAWNRTPAKPREAILTALQGFEDGLFRVFQNERELEELDAPLELRENDRITFIRLVMLTGRFY